MIKISRVMAGVVLAAMLAACGGGGGSPGGTDTGGTGGTGNGGGTTPTATSRVADFAVVTDKTTINNSGLDSTTLTVTAVDANRNIVSGASVAVSVDSNAVFVPLFGIQTDDTGTYKGTISAGSDKTDRDITATVTINGLTKNVVVHVAGTRVTLQAVPSSPAPGQSVTLTSNVVDSAGNPIPNIVVTLGGGISAIQGRTMTTNATGVATTTFNAPLVAGTYTVTATGNGVSAVDYQVQVFSSAVPAAIIPPSSTPSLAASPNVLAVNAPGSTANKSTLRFLFLDSNNNPIQNVRVKFVDTTTGLPAVGASISTGNTTLYTDTSGSVSAQYISGQNSSPTNGVTVRACYKASDFTNVGDCPNFVTATLTVAGQALAVSIGDDNLLGAGPGTYIKRFAVTVADSAGRAVANAPVDISVDLTHYAKGSFGDLWGPDPGLLPLEAVPSDLTASYPSASTTPGGAMGNVWCRNEDFNRNGNVDLGIGENPNGSKDSNGQDTLEPRRSDLLISYSDPNVTTTNASGILVIKVEYSQRFATWLAYKIRVTANVAGSQGMAERLFVTDYLQGDAGNGSFHQAPYGTQSCNSPN